MQSAIALVRSIGRGAKLAKVDVKAAFRCVPVHPSDRWLLGMQWDGAFYADLALPFGLKSSPGIWERYASLAEWILRRAGVRHLIHYVDDFLVGGAPDSEECAHAVSTIVAVFKRLGIPISTSKFEAEATPTTVVRFLGILIDSLRMEARLDTDRVAAIKAALKLWLTRKTCSRTELQSLIGVLSFAARVVPAGRTFLRRLISTLSSSGHSFRAIMLGDDFRADLRWWQAFIAEWNGVALLPAAHWTAPGNQMAHTAPVFELSTDACTTGFGAVWGAKWMHGQWSPEQLGAAKRKQTISMPYLEMLAIALALSTWGPLLRGLKITVQCDAQSAVQALQGFTCSDSALMHLIRIILWLAAKHSFAIRCVHIAGRSNVAADLLSRGAVQAFRAAFPGHESGPTPSMPLPPQTW